MRALAVSLLVVGATATAEAGWDYSEDIDRLDGRKTVAVVAATKDTTISPQRERSRTGRESFLVVACQKGKPAFYYTIPRQLVAGHSARVSYRLDDLPPETNRRWDISDDHTSVGSWGSSAVPFLKRAMTAKTLMIRTEDSVFGQTEAVFDITGLGTAIQPVRQACRW